MGRLFELLHLLGNAGAVENAGELAAARRREDWVIAELQRTTAKPTRARLARLARPAAARRAA